MSYHVDKKIRTKPLMCHVHNAWKLNKFWIPTKLLTDILWLLHSIILWKKKSLDAMQPSYCLCFVAEPVCFKFVFRSLTLWKQHQNRFNLKWQLFIANYILTRPPTAKVTTATNYLRKLCSYVIEFTARVPIAIL